MKELDTIGPDHLAHLLAAKAQLDAAQMAFQIVQRTIMEALQLPPGVQIAADGRILRAEKGGADPERTNEKEALHSSL